MPENFLDPCSVPLQQDQIDDPAPPFCTTENCDQGQPNLRRPAGAFESWEEEDCGTVDGAAAICNPMQTGQIINDLDNVNHNVIYRYSKALRGCDEAMRDLFSNVVVIDDNGKAHKVPIVYATQERAVAALVQPNMRQDSVVVDRIRLPAMAIYATGYNFSPERYLYNGIKTYRREDSLGGSPGYTKKDPRGAKVLYGVSRGYPIDVTYTLYGWTMFVEDMNEILEQIFLKFDPFAYIRVRGISWEIGVKLESSGKNIDLEPGDKNERVLKFEIDMTAQTFIPQPITRKRAVLSTRVDFLDGLTEEDAVKVLDRIEESIKE